MGLGELFVLGILLDLLWFICFVSGFGILVILVIMLSWCYACGF